MSSKELIQSDQELYVFWFLEELKEAGYIKEYTLQPKAFELSDDVEYSWWKPKPIKSNPDRLERKTNNLLSASEYTADCRVVWNIKALDIFYVENFPKSNKCNLLIAYDGISYIETKEGNNFKNMTRLFITKQKWIYQLYSIYINLVIPVKLFESMFTPSRYLIQNKTKQPRKIKFKTRTLKEYEESISSTHS